MQPKMLYMRKTPLSGGAILFLLSAGFVLFPTQWLGDLMTQDELLAQMLGLGILRIVMAAIMLVLALQMGIRGVWAPAKLPYLLFALPALAVAVNNLPVVALCRGTAGVTGGGEYVAAFALQCLGVGLFEEVAFRGVIFPFALGVTGTGKKGRFAAVLLSSAAFGLLHLVNLLGGFSGGVFLQVGYSFLIGCMLSVCVFCGQRRVRLRTCARGVQFLRKSHLLGRKFRVRRVQRRVVRGRDRAHRAGFSGGDRVFCTDFVEKKSCAGGRVCRCSA